MEEFKLLEKLKNNLVDALVQLKPKEIGAFIDWLEIIVRNMQVSNLINNNIYDIAYELLHDLSIKNNEKLIEFIVDEYICNLQKLEVEMYITDPNSVRDLLRTTLDHNEIDKILSNKITKF